MNRSHTRFLVHRFSGPNDQGHRASRSPAMAVLRNAAVPRLSIVIPALGHNDLLENGLVSVLEHRPADSEVLVVLNGPYGDPYNLADEIRFVQAPAQAGLLDCLNLGYRSSTGDAIHFLGCGFEVAVGWADGPLARLDAAGVGAVVPILMQPGSHDAGVLAGVAYDPAGRAGLHFGSDTHWLSESEPLGPIGLAAFYSAAALETLDEVFSASVGPQWSDVDLALRLRAAGFRVEIEGTSRIIGDPSPFVNDRPGLQRARFAERLYWRHAAEFGHGKLLLPHLAVVAGEAARSFPRPRILGELFGRVLGCVESLGQRSARPAPRPSPAATMSDAHRLDPSHDPSGPTLEPAAPARTRTSRTRV